jgi:hypothetical protein
MNKYREFKNPRKETVNGIEYAILGAYLGRDGLPEVFIASYVHPATKLIRYCEFTAIELPGQRGEVADGKAA